MNPSTRVIRQALNAWIVDWAHWTLVSILWVICWLTVILGPPATFALAYACQRTLYGETPGLRDLAAVAGRCFASAWLWMLINLPFIFIVWMGLRLSAGFSAGWLLWLFVWILVLLWWAGQFYALPLFFEQGMKNILLAERHAFMIVLSGPWFTLAVAGAGFAAAIFSLVLVAPLAFGGPPLVGLLASHAVDNRLVAGVPGVDL